MADDPESCQALAGRIEIEMDQQLEKLDDLEGIPFPRRPGDEFVQAFKRAAGRRTVFIIKLMNHRKGV